MPVPLHTPNIGIEHEPDVRGAAEQVVLVPEQTRVPDWAQPPVPPDTQEVPVTRQIPPQSLCPDGHTHVPEPEQTRPPAHAAPHAPQLAVLVRRSVSQPLLATPSQLPKPTAQVPTPQTPTMQTGVALGGLHVTPQPPQLFTSEPRTLRSHPLAAMRSQSAVPAAHVSPQTPLMQYGVPSADGQTVVQLPQCSGSLARMTQLPEQLVCPDWQVTPQTPPEQRDPPTHTVPQAPQLALSVRVSTSQPLAATRSQSAKPGEQAAIVQPPDEQAAVALGSAQARPQTPQFATAVWRFISQPFAAVPSQSPKPTAQRTTVQAPVAQPFAATLARAQVVPQALQLAGSMAVLAQYADDPAPQTRSGEAQVVPQTPPEQTAPAPHDIAQAPQLALSVRV